MNTTSLRHAMELHNHECLPRLLDLDPPPSVGSQRWFWRYLHRWRRRLFNAWQSDVHTGVDVSALGHAVDEIIGVALLIEHLRRSGCEHLPTLAEPTEPLVLLASNLPRKALTPGRRRVMACPKSVISSYLPHPASGQAGV